ncbi:MAG: hypothetical protein H6740_26365 [Alphaproteobacteria bacterium]|nr:hypothetical protein [Alphaproteobacteria bacterium]
MWILLSIACTGKSAPAVDSSVDCAAPLSVYPVDGQTDAYVGDIVYAQLDGPAADATLSVGDVPGQSSVEALSLAGGAEGSLVRFTPDARLSPSTEYTATLSWCDRETSWSFRTSALGAPLEDPESLDGQVYRLSPWSGEFLEPENYNQLVNLFAEPPSYLLELHVGEAGALSVRVATEAPAGGQDLCYPTADLTMHLDPDPHLEYGPTDTPLYWGPAEWQLEALRFTGSFVSDGSALAEAAASGVVHLEDLTAGLPDTAGLDACELAIGFGLSCQPCEDGREDCLPFSVIRMTAPAVTQSPLEVVERYGCHEACPEACDGGG